MKLLLAVSVVVLLFTNAVTYALLLLKNEEWKMVVTEKNNSRFELAEALKDYLYYDGDSIPCSQTVRHYTRSGKLIENRMLGEVMQGDKVVMLLSPNCCSACAREEIEKLLNLSKEIGREHVAIMADFAIHKQSSWTLLFDNVGYYETEVEHLGLRGSPARETPVVMLTQNGRVKTSFVVGQQTSAYADRFHEYLSDYFKGRK